MMWKTRKHGTLKQKGLRFRLKHGYGGRIRTYKPQNDYSRWVECIHRAEMVKKEKDLNKPSGKVVSEPNGEEGKMEKIKEALLPKVEAELTYLPSTDPWRDHVKTTMLHNAVASIMQKVKWRPEQKIFQEPLDVGVKTLWLTFDKRSGEWKVWREK